MKLDLIPCVRAGPAERWFGCLQADSRLTKTSYTLKFSMDIRYAAYYNKPKFWPGNVRFWSFDIVLRLNRELGGV